MKTEKILLRQDVVNIVQTMLDEDWIDLNKYAYLLDVIDDLAIEATDNT